MKSIQRPGAHSPEAYKARLEAARAVGVCYRRCRERIGRLERQAEGIAAAVRLLRKDERTRSW